MTVTSTAFATAVTTEVTVMIPMSAQTMIHFARAVSWRYRRLSADVAMRFGSGCLKCRIGTRSFPKRSPVRCSVPFIRCLSAGYASYTGTDLAVSGSERLGIFSFPTVLDIV